MLFEVRAEGFSYDIATDTARLEAPGAAGTGRRGLLDARGFLVGVDLRGDDGRGAVVMLGPHEAVAGTTELAVTLEGDLVVIAGARASVRAAEKNPYV